MRATKVKQWDFVRSHYRAGWLGIVVEVEPRAGMGALVTVVPIVTAKGQQHRKRHFHVLDEHWLTVEKDPGVVYHNPQYPARPEHAGKIVINPNWIVRPERE